ncbi:unnamed protein product, partial [Polarella glacialis]
GGDRDAAWDDKVGLRRLQALEDSKFSLVHDALRPLLQSHWLHDPKLATHCLGGLAKAQRWRLAGAVLQAMKAEGLEVNIFHCNVAVNACERGGAWAASLALLAQMAACQVELDTVSYSSAIKSSGVSDQKLNVGSSWRLPLSLLG